MKNKLITISILLAATLYLTGCGKVTGGGTIQSVSGIDGEKANYTFTIDNCDPSTPPKGRLLYHDETAPSFQPGGIKIKAAIIDSGDWIPSDGVTYTATFRYKSQNPDFPGTGTGDLVINDNGEGSNSLHDTADILIHNGPYEGYYNSGILNGNIQGHECKE